MDRQKAHAESALKPIKAELAAVAGDLARAWASEGPAGNVAAAAERN